ncbi:MAG: DUF86 domain-containing protein [Clostridiales bacterium]|nr:DUF86 domain-containing protein [Clostridiales bacterium]
MNKIYAVNEISSIVAPILEAFGVERAWVFGSYARGEATESSDIDYRNSVCMSLLQIGELTGHLSEDYRETTKELVYWPAIKGMRNVFAHDYGAIDYDRVWDTVIEDIPILLEFCQKENLSYQIAEQEEELQDEDMER